MLLQFFRRIRSAWHAFWHPVDTVIFDGTVMTIHADAEYHYNDDCMHIDMLMIVNHEALHINISIPMPEYHYFQENPDSFRNMLIYRLSSGFRNQVFEKLLKQSDVRKILKLGASDGR